MPCETTTRCSGARTFSASVLVKPPMAGDAVSTIAARLRVLDANIRAARAVRTANEFPDLPVMHVRGARVLPLAEALGRLYAPVPGRGQCGRQSLSLNCKAMAWG